MNFLQGADSAGAAAASEVAPMPPYAPPSSDRLRLLTFMTLFGIGGTEKQVVNLSKLLDRERFALRFGCLKRWGELLEEVEREGFVIDEYPIMRLYGREAMRQQWRFARALARDRVQIMHSYNFYANVFSIPAARMARVPCVVASVRDLGVYLTPAQCRVQNWACRLADVVLVNAEAIRRWMIAQGFPEKKLRVIRNGVDLAKFRVKADGSLRRELELPPQAPVVVMLARLDPKKGVEYFLRAAPRIMERCPDTYFVVVGEAFLRDPDDERRPDLEQRRELERRAAELGIGEHIRFVGMRPDVPEILAMATVSVLPSFSEGLSNTLLESMAAGVAVVATDVGGTPEVIRNGCDGILVPPANTRAIVDAVCSILEDPLLAARLRAQGRERVASAFSFDKMTRATEAVYDELMQRKRRGNHQQVLGA
ncbi:MAG TPA: glycosyltransferase [Gammaproteobacteria bacterium]|nr:glycosyltransferase [Gammaproteobacteria bacterium]